MFTGIVTHQGQLLRADAAGPDGVLRLQIQPDTPLQAPQVGESIALDGVCLTLVNTAGGRLSFDVIPETVRVTTLAQWSQGRRVNLERALRLGDALGGHIVQGHIDGVAQLVQRTTRGEDVRLALLLPEPLSGTVIAKGSVTLNGVSLTVGEIWEEHQQTAFSVYLIPHTLRITNLGAAQPGSQLNVEVDMMGRWVAHHLARMGLGCGPVAPGV